MAYDDLKRIAGVRVGALPALNLSKTIAPAKSPQVVQSPARALTLALGRAGARDLRTAVLSSTRAAPVQAVAASVLSTASPVSAASSAPAPAPMPRNTTIAPLPTSSLLNISKAAQGIIQSTPLPPPPAPPVAEPPPLLAASPAPPSAIVADHPDDGAQPQPSPPPPADAPPALTLGASARALVPAGVTRSFAQVQRSQPSPTALGAALFSGPASRGFAQVQRAQAPQTTNDTTTKGRAIMANRYRGTGEITYCPINSDGPINAGASATLPGIRPQKPFQSQELLIDPVTGDTFDITDIKIGNEPVGVTAGSVSAANFPPSNGPKFSWKVADGVDIIFSVQNTGTLTVAFTAMLVGEVVEAA